MVVAPREFKDEEYLEPKVIFENEGYEVVTASKGVDIAQGKAGTKVVISEDVTEVDFREYKAIVLVGGWGAVVFQKDFDVRQIVEDANDEKMLIGAICIAPTILAYAGILKGKKATVWDGDHLQGKIIEGKGAIYTARAVEIDGNIITANGSAVAKDFAKRIIRYLKEN